MVTYAHNVTPSNPNSDLSILPYWAYLLDTTPDEFFHSKISDFYDELKKNHAMLTYKEFMDLKSKNLTLEDQS